MSSVRDICIEIEKSLKYQNELDNINKCQKSEQKERENKKLKDKVNRELDSYYCKKLSDYIKATYVALGLNEKNIKEIKDENAYNKFKNDLIELCKMVSYDNFFTWMVRDWKSYYIIKAKNAEELTIKVEYYLKLKFIVLSLIKATENNDNIKIAQAKYNNSADMYKLMLKEITSIGESEKNKETKIHINEKKYDVEQNAKEALIKYKYIIENMDKFDERNYFIKSKAEDKRTIKSLDKFFLINKHAIPLDMYNSYLELKERYYCIESNITDDKKEERYRLYEIAIVSDNPNLEEYDYIELDLLQRCRREYKINQNIDIKECIKRNEKAIKDENIKLFDDRLVDFDW